MWYRVLILLGSSVVIFGGLVEGKIYTECEAAQALQNAGISKTFISNWVCLMKSESGLNTQLVTGPGTASSYAYGIFQISSRKHCTRGRKGGVCNQKCEDFLKDDITEAIACAVKIQETEGFKYWPGWVKKCKDKTLSDIGICKSRRRRRMTI